MVKLILNIKNEDVELTIEDARKLYNELDLMFNIRPCSVPLLYQPTFTRIDNSGDVANPEKPITNTNYGAKAIQFVANADRGRYAYGGPTWAT